MVLGQEGQEVGGVQEDDLSADLDILELGTEDEINMKVKKHSLVGKVVADKHIKVGLLRVIFSKAWPVKSSLEVHELERNIFLMALEATLEEIDFFTSEFRVQIHNLLLNLLTRSNAAKIVSVFTEMVEFDCDKDEDILWNSIMRMRS
ncbi:hypothetical protein REPUB_Repub10bG0098900 [Reevesia pubescens]